MPTESLYCDIALGPGWANVTNAQGDTAGTFTSDGFPLGGPDERFQRRLLISDTDGGATFSQIHPQLSVPAAKAFVVFGAFAVAPTVAVAKAQGLRLEIRVENDDEDITATLYLTFAAAAHAALPDAATFVSVEVEMSHDDANLKVYRARINWSVPATATNAKLLSRPAAMAAANAAARPCTAHR